MAVRVDPATRVAFLDGVVDLEEARRVRDAVLELVPGQDTVIDCHEVREMHDSALAYLVIGLQLAHRTVAVRGLDDHQRRLLEYLHVPAKETPS